MPPKFIRPFFWFNDFKKIDLQRDKNRIILNLLNFGTKRTTDWLFAYYPKSEIKKTIINYGARGGLNPKSLNYWRLVLNIDPQKLVRSRL